MMQSLWLPFDQSLYFFLRFNILCTRSK